jgi:AcrR family transcriptional regulator
MSRKTYHHGDLRDELLRTGLRLADEGGPSAVSVREAAREVGVSVAALYRHFSSAEQWRADVSRLARQRLAESMLQMMAETQGSRSPAVQARRRFRACGEGYVHFAVTSPGLFQTAFMPCDALPSQADEPSAWNVLCSALDDLVEAGLISRRMRPDAPLIAWTAIHGLSALVVQRAVDTEGTLAGRVDVVSKAVERALGISGTLPR